MGPVGRGTRPGTKVDVDSDEKRHQIKSSWEGYHLETVEEAKESTFQSSAVRITDRRPLFRRQSILDERSGINIRMTKLLAEWEQLDADGAELDKVTSKPAVCSKGSFLLTKHSLLTEKEAKTNYIYQLINRIMNEETREQLKVFVDRYRQQNMILQDVNRDTESILAEVIESMQMDCCSLQSVQSTHLSLVLEREQEVKNQYLDTMSNMEKLRYLRSQTAPYKITQKSKQLLAGKKKKKGGDFGYQDADLPSARPDMETGAEDPLRELLRNVHGAREYFKAVEMGTFKKKINDIVHKLKADEAELKSVSNALIETEMATKKMQMSNQTIKKDSLQVQMRINEMLEDERATRAAASGRRTDAGGRLVEMVDCSTQTRDILYDSGLKTPARAQAQTSRLAASFRQQDQDSIAGEPSAEDQGFQDAFRSRKLTPTMPSSWAEEERRKASLYGTRDDPRGEAGFGRRSIALINRFKRKPKAEASVAPGMVIDDPSDSVELACKELAEQLPKLSPDEASALLTKRLRLVLMNHIDQSVDHARTLLSDVLDLRSSAREDSQIIAVKKQQIKKLEAKIENLVYIRDDQEPPVVEADENPTVLQNRVHGTHECPFCLCHDVDAQVDVLVSLGDSHDVDRMLQECGYYIAFFGTVEGKFADAYDYVVDIHTAVNTLQCGLVCENLNSVNAAVDVNCDDEVLENLVASAMDVPHDTEGLLKHATHVAQTIDTLITEIKAALDSCKRQMEELTVQEKQLWHLKHVLPQVQQVEDPAGLRYEGLLDRENYLETARILRAGACPYCKCRTPCLELDKKLLPREHLDRRINTMIFDVMLLRRAVEGVVRLTSAQYDELLTRYGEESAVPELMGNVIRELTRGLDIVGKQLQDFDTGENQERMFIMDAKGWRRVSSLAEMPVTTVSVPGQGLPKLTGLKHELVDPGYYDRHRHDVVDSHKPHIEWLRTRRESVPSSAATSEPVVRKRRTSRAKNRQAAARRRAELTRRFSRQGSLGETTPYRKLSDRRSRKSSQAEEKDGEGAARRRKSSLGTKSKKDFVRKRSPAQYVARGDSGKADRRGAAAAAYKTRRTSEAEPPAASVKGSSRLGTAPEQAKEKSDSYGSKTSSFSFETPTSSIRSSLEDSLYCADMSEFSSSAHESLRSMDSEDIARAHADDADIAREGRRRAETELEGRERDTAEDRRRLTEGRTETELEGKDRDSDKDRRRRREEGQRSERELEGQDQDRDSAEERRRRRREERRRAERELEGQGQDRNSAEERRRRRREERRRAEQELEGQGHDRDSAEERRRRRREERRRAERELEGQGHDRDSAEERRRRRREERRRERELKGQGYERDSAKYRRRLRDEGAETELEGHARDSAGKLQTLKEGGRRKGERVEGDGRRQKRSRKKEGKKQLDLEAKRALGVYLMEQIPKEKGREYPPEVLENVLDIRQTWVQGVPAQLPRQAEKESLSGSSSRLASTSSTETEKEQQQPTSGRQSLHRGKLLRGKTFGGGRWPQAASETLDRLIDIKSFAEDKAPPPSSSSQKKRAGPAALPAREVPDPRRLSLGSIVTVVKLRGQEQQPATAVSEQPLQEKRDSVPGTRRAADQPDVQTKDAAGEATATAAEPPVTPGEPPVTGLEPQATAEELPEPPAQPPVTPTEPLGTPTDTPGTPTEPVETPMEPLGTPTEIPGTPTELVETPMEPLGTPTEIPGTPTEPLGTTTETPGTPIKPLGTPTETPRTPTETLGTPTKPLGTPTEPPGTPGEPLGTPGEPTESAEEPPAGRPSVTAGEPSVTGEESLVTPDTLGVTPDTQGAAAEEPFVARDSLGVTSDTRDETFDTRVEASEETPAAPYATREASSLSRDLSLERLLRQPPAYPPTPLPLTGAQTAAQAVSGKLPQVYGRQLRGADVESPLKQSASAHFKMSEKKHLSTLLPSARPDEEASLSLSAGSGTADDLCRQQQRSRADSISVKALCERIVAGEREMRTPADLTRGAIVGVNVAAGRPKKPNFVLSPEFIQQMEASILKGHRDSQISWDDGLPVLLTPAEMRERRVPAAAARSREATREARAAAMPTKCNLTLEKAPFDEDSRLASLRQRARQKSLESFQKIKRGRSGLKSSAGARRSVGGAARAPALEEADEEYAAEQLLLSIYFPSASEALQLIPEQVPAAPSPSDRAQQPSRSAPRPAASVSDSATGPRARRGVGLPAAAGVEAARRKEARGPGGPGAVGGLPAPALTSVAQAETNPLHRLFGHLYTRPSPAQPKEGWPNWTICPRPYQPSAPEPQVPAPSPIPPSGLQLSGSTVGPISGVQLSGSTLGPPPSGVQLSGSTVGPSSGVQLSGSTGGPPSGLQLSGSTVGPPSDLQLSGSTVGPPSDLQFSGSIVGPPSGVELSSSTVGPPSDLQFAGPAAGFEASDLKELPPPERRPSAPARSDGPPQVPAPAGPRPPSRSFVPPPIVWPPEICRHVSYLKVFSPPPTPAPQRLASPPRRSPSPAPRPAARSPAPSSRLPPLQLPLPPPCARRAVPPTQPYYSKCAYFRRTRRGVTGRNPWPQPVSSLRISRSAGVVRALLTPDSDDAALLLMVSRLIRDAKAGPRSARGERGGGAEQGHFPDAVWILKGSGYGAKEGPPLPQVYGEAWPKRDPAHLVSAFGWFTEKECAAAGWKDRGAKGGGAAASCFYLASPNDRDRFFFENKRSMITLAVKVAEMETYERLRQRVRRRSLRGARLAKGSKPASVITNPAMEQHLRLGRKLLKEQENEKAFGEEALDDLLENILLYDVPGISKMRGDYTALLETQVSDSSDSDGRVLDVNASAALGGGTGNPSQPAPNAFLPSLLTGQRS